MFNDVESWNNVYEKSEGAKYPNENIIRFVARNYYSENNRKNLKILELGCGTGNNVWFLAREGFNAYGIDISEKAISKAKKRLTEENLVANLLVGNIINIGFPDNFFDAVIDGAAIESNGIDDIRKIIKETFRVLKNGGRFFSLMLSTDSYGYEGSAYTADGDPNDNIRNIEYGRTKRRGRLHYFSLEDIGSLLSQARFVNINIGYIQSSLDNINHSIKYWLVEAMKA